MAGAGIANNGTPQSVQTWLKGAEPIAIICTALDGLLCVGGILLSYLLVDKQGSPTNDANTNATAITISDGTIDLTTATPPPVPGSQVVQSPRLIVDRKTGISLLNQRQGGGATITVDGTTVTITVGGGGGGGGSRITMKDGDVTIEATTITFYGQVKNNPPRPFSAPTTPKTIGLSSDGNSNTGGPVPMQNWGTPNWPPGAQ